MVAGSKDAREREQVFSKPRQPASRSALLEAAALVVVLVLAAAIRLSPWYKVHADGAWLFSDGDTYYHLRRIEQTIERGGRVPMFDPYLAFPYGQRSQWHIGYDLLVSGAVVAVCGPKPERDCLEPVAALSTPLLGVVATLVVFFLGVAVASHVHGLIAAALFAIYPFSAGSAALGHVDHQVLEPVMVAAVLWALAKRRPKTAGVLAGIAFAFFPSALLPFGVITAALILERVWRLRRGVGSDRTALWFTATAFLILIPIVASGAFPDRFEPAATSLFHLAILAAFVVITAALEATASFWTVRRAAAFFPLAAIACAASVFAGTEHWVPLFRFGIGKPSGMWIGMQQQQPLASGPVVAVILALWVISGCCWTVLNAWRTDSRALGLTGMTALPLTLLGILQIRFLMPASPALVIVIAHVLIELQRFVAGRLARLSPRAGVLGYANYAVLVLLVLSPTAEYWRQNRQPPTLEAGTRLLRRFGQTRPSNIVASVLSDWPWGDHILYFTGLPTVASPFILSGVDRENVEATRALLSERPEPLYRTMQSRGSRYLLVSDFFSAARAAASVGQRPPRAPAAEQLMARDIHGWSRLRLIDLEPGARLFELVQSARLVGRAAPDSLVTATLDLLSMNGESIRLIYQTISSHDGRFVLGVPQPTDTHSKRLSVVGRYRIGGCEIAVTERQIDQGSAVQVVCPIHLQ